MGRLLDHWKDSMEQTRQRNAPWGLAKLSNPSAGTVFEYPESSGCGVDVYIIDSGIKLDHSQFEGRAVWGMSSRGRGITDECAGINLDHSQFKGQAKCAESRLDMTTHSTSID